MQNPENRVFEQQEKQQSMDYKPMETTSAKDLSKKILNLEEKLDKFSKTLDKQGKLSSEVKDFVIRNMNDYLKAKYGCEFQKDKKGNLILVVDKNHKSDLAKLSNVLQVADNAVFVDANGNGKMDKDEMGIKLDKSGKIEANAIYVDNNELKNSFVSFGKEYTDSFKQGVNDLIEFSYKIGSVDLGQSIIKKIEKFKDSKDINEIKDALILVEEAFKEFQAENANNPSIKEVDGFSKEIEEFKKIKEKLTSNIYQDRQVLDTDYTHGGKLIFEKGQVYYLVGKNETKEKGKGQYDHLAAVSRLFTALSDEYFGGLSQKEIEQRIKNLYYNPKTNKFSSFKNESDAKKEGFTIHPGDLNSKEWYKIVKPGAKINLFSLAQALGVKDKNKDKNIDSKETKDVPEGWGVFYMSGGKEIWDIPDNKTIDYHGYSTTYTGLKGNQISISADSLYDIGNKEKGLNGKNTFSEKVEVKVGGKDGFLVIGEKPDDVTVSDYKDKTVTVDSLKTDLGNKKVEAWLVTVGKDGKWTITEVGDKAVHTITETSDTVERGKDPNHPIIAKDGVVKLDGFISGDLKITKAKPESTDKKDKSEEFTVDWKDLKIGEGKPIDKMSKDIFKKMFGADVAYVAVDGKVLKLNYDDKEKTIVAKEVKSDFKDSFSVGGVNILSNGLTGFTYEAKTGYIHFPEVKGWGSIEGKLEPVGEGKKPEYFVLNHKIADKEVKIRLYDVSKDKLNVESLYQDITLSLLLATTENNLSSNWVNNENLYLDSKKGDLVIDYNLKNIDKEKKNAVFSVIRTKVEDYRKGKDKGDYLMDYVDKEIAKKLEGVKQEKTTNADKVNIDNKKANSKEIQKNKIEITDTEKTAIKDILSSIKLSTNILRNKGINAKWLKEFDDDVSVHNISFEEKDGNYFVKFDFDDKWQDESYNCGVKLDLGKGEKLTHLKKSVDDYLNTKDPKEKQNKLMDLQLQFTQLIKTEAIPQAIKNMEKFDKEKQIKANLEKLKNIDSIVYNADDLGVKDNRLRQFINNEFSNGIWLSPDKDKISYDEKTQQYTFVLKNSKLGEFKFIGKDLAEISKNVRENLKKNVMSKIKEQFNNYETQETIDQNISKIQNDLKGLKLGKEGLGVYTSDQKLLIEWLSMFDNQQAEIDTVKVEKTKDGYNFVIEFNNKGLNKDFNKDIKVFVSKDELEHSDKLSDKLVHGLGNILKDNQEFHDKYASYYIYHTAVKEALNNFKSYKKAQEKIAKQKEMQEKIAKGKEELENLDNTLYNIGDLKGLDNNAKAYVKDVMKNDIWVNIDKVNFIGFNDKKEPIYNLEVSNSKLGKFTIEKVSSKADAEKLIKEELVKGLNKEGKEYVENQKINNAVSSIEKNLSDLTLSGEVALTSGNKKLLEFIGGTDEKIGVSKVNYDKTTNTLTIEFSNDKKLNIKKVDADKLSKLAKNKAEDWKKLILSKFDKTS